MTPEQRLKQSRVKMRLLAEREMREFMRGDLDFIPGDYERRGILDAIQKAYEAGQRMPLPEPPEDV